MTKRKVTSTKKTKPVKTTKTEKTPSKAVQEELEVPSSEENQTKNAKTERPKTENSKTENPKTENPKKIEAEQPKEQETTPEEPQAEVCTTPRRSVAFIGSECYPFVKTGGLGDVMYALPKALIKQNCDVKVILPRYKCIPQEYQEKIDRKSVV